MEYIDQLENGTAWFTAEDLAQALKIVINSVYGLTAANFENPFRDPRNKDNIVAKRGALFMTLLKSEVEKRGFCVAHIKTDSIKIPDATPEIMDFVIRFGKEYGYLFETEANFEKFCLVNDAVYVAKFKDGKHAGEWTATVRSSRFHMCSRNSSAKSPSSSRTCARQNQSLRPYIWI